MFACINNADIFSLQWIKVDRNQKIYMTVYTMHSFFLLITVYVTTKNNTLTSNKNESDIHIIGDGLLIKEIWYISKAFPILLNLFYEQSDKLEIVKGWKIINDILFLINEQSNPCFYSYLLEYICLPVHALHLKIDYFYNNTYVKVICMLIQNVRTYSRSRRLFIIHWYITNMICDCKPIASYTKGRKNKGTVFILYSAHTHTFSSLLFLIFISSL
jgi:hypothetical protein